MAARTPLSLAEARQLGARWGLSVDACAVVEAGTLNSSFALADRDRRIFLRIFEHVGLVEAEAEGRLLVHLAGRGVPTPAPLCRVDRPDVYAAEHAGKPALALPWIDGAIVCARAVTPAHARAVGATLAKIHRGGAGAPSIPAARFGLDRLDARLAAATLPANRPDLGATLDRLRARIAAAAVPLPVRGVIHGDPFRENVLWSGEALVGIVDFEAACAGNFAVDLMIAALAWCFGDHFELTRLRALVDGYRGVRALVDAEQRELYPAAVTAALRFSATRLLDYELGAAPGGWRDHRRFLARLDGLEALGPAGWHAALGLQ